MKPDMQDPFRPPSSQVLVRCLHCDQVYPSSEMVYEERFGQALWWCKTPGCSGAGYGFDIHQVRA